MRNKSQGYRFNLLLICLGAMLFSCNGKTDVEFPKKHLNQNKAVNYTEMTSILHQLAEKDFISIESMGKTIENRELWLLNIKPKNQIENPLKVFLFAQQHGNEPAGKDALIWLAKYLAENNSLKNKNIDLWLMPMVNPNGAEINQRKNAAGADLNRDHLLLSQSETQLLYKAFHKIKPNITIDCHEFNRTSESFIEKGLEEWPQIMMDCGSNPLIAEEFYNLGVKTIDMMKEPMKIAEHNFCRYYLGGMPPQAENRFSTMEADDARNGMALLGSLSFIIESGVKRNVEKPDFDLGKRVDAYLTIFKEILNNEGFIMEVNQLFQITKKSPEFLPTNYFWGKTDDKIDTVMVIKNGKNSAIPTANFMKTRILKKSVISPDYYIIPENQCEVYRSLLSRHQIEFEILEQDKILEVERVKLLRIEREFDEIYNRYGGRQITDNLEVDEKLFPKGSIIVYPKNNTYALKVFYLLEPSNLYGLYQFSEFYDLTADEILPVYRGFYKEK